MVHFKTNGIIDSQHKNYFNLKIQDSVISKKIIIMYLPLLILFHQSYSYAYYVFGLRELRRDFHKYITLVNQLNMYSIYYYFSKPTVAMQV